jgi:hypothetical protein
LPAQRGEAFGCGVVADEVVDRGFLFSHEGIRSPVDTRVRRPGGMAPHPKSSRSACNLRSDRTP